METKKSLIKLARYKIRLQQFIEEAGKTTIGEGSHARCERLLLEAIKEHNDYLAISVAPDLIEEAQRELKEIP